MSVGVYTSHGDVSFTTAVNNALCQTHKHLFARGNSVTVENSIHAYRLTLKHTAHVHENTQGNTISLQSQREEGALQLQPLFSATAKLNSHRYLETKRLVK